MIQTGTGRETKQEVILSRPVTGKEIVDALEIIAQESKGTQKVFKIYAGNRNDETSLEQVGLSSECPEKNVDVRVGARTLDQKYVGTEETYTVLGVGTTRAPPGQAVQCYAPGQFLIDTELTRVAQGLNLILNRLR